MLFKGKVKYNLKTTPSPFVCHCSDVMSAQGTILYYYYYRRKGDHEDCFLSPLSAINWLIGKVKVAFSQRAPLLPALPSIITFQFEARVVSLSDMKVFE